MRLLILALLVMGGCAPNQPLPLSPQRAICPPIAPDVRCEALPEYAGKDFLALWAEVMFVHGVCAESLRVWQDTWQQCKEE